MVNPLIISFSLPYRFVPLLIYGHWPQQRNTSQQLISNLESLWSSNPPHLFISPKFYLTYFAAKYAICQKITSIVLAINIQTHLHLHLSPPASLLFKRRAYPLPVQNLHLVLMIPFSPTPHTCIQLLETSLFNQASPLLSVGFFSSAFKSTQIFLQSKNKTKCILPFASLKDFSTCTDC